MVSAQNKQGQRTSLPRLLWLWSPLAEQPDPTPWELWQQQGPAWAGSAVGCTAGEPVQGGAAASLLDLLFTFMSPNIAGRLCVFVPKSRWYRMSSSINSRCGFLTRTSPVLQGDDEEMGWGTRQCLQGGGQAEVGHRAAWKLHKGTHSLGIGQGMEQGQGTSQLYVVFGLAVFLLQVISLTHLLLYLRIWQKICLSIYQFCQWLP